MKLIALILCMVAASASARAAEKPFDVRFAETYARHLVKMDADYLADVFRKHEETSLWQTEFWGKYMHSAVPLVKRFPNAELESHIRSSARIVMDSQLDDGYIGNYCGMPSCSVLGPIVWLYRVTKDRRYLAFAEEIVREVGCDADGPRLVRHPWTGKLP